MDTEMRTETQAQTETETQAQTEAQTQAQTETRAQAEISGQKNPAKISRRGITGSTLKLIAMLSMLLDHTGAIVLMRALVGYGVLEVVDAEGSAAFMAAHAGLYYTYVALRQVGRIAFPLFCFLLVQGVLHTHDLKKYLGRLFLFALISEVPFDLGMFGTVCTWGYQNVYFTL
ncbi:MAG: TraX family protein, partial [Pygmaiobacter sp.]|nr:TraX family protein [Pygmaiobacter sp.]